MKLFRRKDEPEKVVPDGFTWIPLEAVTRWEPQIDDVCTGIYVGMRSLHGSFGTYQAVIINCRNDKAVMITGSMLIAMFEGGRVAQGDLVRIVYRGEGRSNITGFTHKKFEAYVVKEQTARGTRTA